MSNTPAPYGSAWVKSTYSDGQGGQCVEWAPTYASTHGIVPVRDSKNPGGPTLMLSTEGFAGLVALARDTDA
ncbi:protein of unknown function DUF397 [Actinobacteria bacterium OK074]|nr:protein of unknown function DUF397 [Actinobacteria bacterium OK074]